MSFFGFFRRWPPIRQIEELAHFIDGNAAMLTQKGIYEYSRARAGHYAKVLFSEREFHEAAERSRWQAYPLGLAMVGEMVEGVLRPYSGEDRRSVLDPLVQLVLSIFDRYPVPACLDEAVWEDARRELAHRLDTVGIHAVKLVKDVPDQFAESYFALMPIHEKMRGRDFPTMRNYLRIVLVNVHDELIKRVDAPAIVAALRAQPI